jgi:hypothetical protein
VDAVLRGVSAAGPDDAWAVGETTYHYRLGGSAHVVAVAEHWDGKRWRRVPAPGLETLVAVTDAPATGAWAVGADTSGAAVAVHWEGSRWRVRLRVPRFELVSLEALSATNLWVVGSDPARRVPRYLELHWNGRHWSRYSQPASADDLGDPRVVAIDAAGTRDLWAAGQVEGPDGTPEGWAKTVLFHWSGTDWRSVPTPQNEFVSALAVRAPDDVVVAGVDGDGDAYGSPFLRRRVAGTWQNTTLGSGEAVQGLAADQAQGFWGVGFKGSHFDEYLGFPHRAQALIVHGVCR